MESHRFTSNSSVTVLLPRAVRLGSSSVLLCGAHMMNKSTAVNDLAKFIVDLTLSEESMQTWLASKSAWKTLRGLKNLRAATIVERLWWESCHFLEQITSGIRLYMPNMQSL